MVDQLWAELQEDLHRFICSRVKHQDHCHDILHDIFLKIAASDRFFDGVENIKPYLIRVASNAITDHYRKANRFKAGEMPGLEEDPGLQDHTLYLSNTFLYKAVAALSDPCREAIIKTEWEGLSQKEYANYAGISLSGAKSRVQRGKIKLKEQILACCDYRFDKYGNVISCCGQETNEGCCR